MSLAGPKAIFLNKSAEEPGASATADDYIFSTLTIEKKDSVCRKRKRSSAFFVDGEIDDVSPIVKRSKNYMVLRMHVICAARHSNKRVISKSTSSRFTMVSHIYVTFAERFTTKSNLNKHRFCAQRTTFYL
ncbi:unnamed protein product [Trichogramma brassicae]|uniref:Uncharacterized protein n=1 Tax=Trichogramma brassicae TaxID=86971 RepID=A0A6H5J0Z2_9HYME|nr:unnamed protein product [Trichogramma brassicae]